VKIKGAPDNQGKGARSPSIIFVTVVNSYLSKYATMKYSLINLDMFINSKYDNNSNRHELVTELEI
jgi:hypothetical protein